MSNLSNCVNRLLWVAGCICLGAGCAPQSPDASPAPPRSSSEQQTLSIEAGRGSDAFFLGMSTRHLTPAWIPGHVAFPGTYPLNTASSAIYHHQELDVTIVFKNKKAATIIYSFGEGKSSLTRKVTSKGISSSSSIREVFLAYGCPELIRRYRFGDSKQDNVSLDFVSSGIQFTYIDDKLDVIYVKAADRISPDVIKLGDHGDTQGLRKLCEEIEKARQLTQPQATTPRRETMLTR